MSAPRLPRYLPAVAPQAPEPEGRSSLTWPTLKAAHKGQRQLIALKAVIQADGDRTKAAKALGVHRNTIYYALKGIDPALLPKANWGGPRPGCGRMLPPPDPKPCACGCGQFLSSAQIRRKFRYVTNAHARQSSPRPMFSTARATTPYWRTR